MEKPKRDFRFFEAWARRNKMRPFARFEEKNGDILIADSGTVIVEGGQMFYRTGFAIDRPGDRTWLASYHDYPWQEFPEHSLAGKQQERINEALAYARSYLQQTHKAGLYDGDKRSFSKPVH